MQGQADLCTEHQVTLIEIITGVKSALLHIDSQLHVVTSKMTIMSGNVSYPRSSSLAQTTAEIVNKLQRWNAKLFGNWMLRWPWLRIVLSSCLVNHGRVELRLNRALAPCGNRLKLQKKGEEKSEISSACYLLWLWHSPGHCRLFSLPWSWKMLGSNRIGTPPLAPAQTHFITVCE